eukprot:758914-Hanusia_phi.AAC.3
MEGQPVLIKRLKQRFELEEHNLTKHSNITQHPRLIRRAATHPTPLSPYPTYPHPTHPLNKRAAGGLSLPVFQDHGAGAAVDKDPRFV